MSPGSVVRERGEHHLTESSQQPLRWGVPLPAGPDEAGMVKATVPEEPEGKWGAAVQSETVCLQRPPPPARREVSKS